MTDTPAKPAIPENVKLFPGVDGLPPPPNAENLPKQTSVKALFKTALALEVHDLVVIGRLPDGELYVGSQSEDLYHVTGLLAKAVTWMTLPEDPEYEYYEDDFPTG